MKCLKNITGTLYKAELVRQLTNLYTYKGKDFYYEDVLKNYLNGIISETIEKDTDYAGRILGLKVTESRKQRIIKNNSEPKTKDEIILSNLKKVFTLIQKKGTNLDLSDNEFLHLAIDIFQNAEKISYLSYEVEDDSRALYPEKKRKFRRDDMIEEIKQYQLAIHSFNIEPTSAITAFYVDLIHMNCFNARNEFMALIILYALLVSQRFNVFKYESFFELYFKNQENFKVVTASASLNWETGYANITMLNEEIIKLMLTGYHRAENRVNDFKFDKTIKKIENVESAIMKLPQTFTRKDIVEACPRLSKSTINRALEELKSENKIRSNGTGRSATWTKLVENESFQTKLTQMSIDDLLNSDDN